jgi:hypothetical protein
MLVEKTFEIPASLTLTRKNILNPYFEEIDYSLYLKWATTDVRLI